MQTKNCQNCKQDFNIEGEDFSFYEKISVPAPTFCPECRFMRRLTFMNVHSLYKDKCKKCDQNMISMYHPEKNLLVYCSKCWWADDWDGTEYAMDYDPNRNFLEQVRELKHKTPLMALDTLYSSLENANYTNYTSHIKNSYALFFADFCENSFYSEFLHTLKDSSDCYRMRKAELSYGSVGQNESFRSIYSLECNACADVYFSKNCSGCTNCFGCMNLKNKSYCIYNQQYTKEEYTDFIKNLDLSSHQTLQEYKKKAEDFWLTQPNRAFYGNSLNVNVSGDYVYESKNAKNMYLVTSAENSRYLQMISVEHTKDSYDYTCWGGDSERIYEGLIAGHGTYDIKFSVGCYPNTLNIEYSYYASGCENVLGCANLKKKSYCILNKEYSKEEFHALKEKIIADMKEHPYIDSKGRIYAYGEFFPSEFSTFGYNETLAQMYYPKTEAEALAQGFNWYKGLGNEYTHTIEAKDLPDQREDFNPIDIIKCSCGKCYKIIEGEMGILKKLGLPIPRKCPECRRLERFHLVLPPKSYNRECAKCSTAIQTAYAPERPEIIYCEKCYQEEIY